LYGTLFFEQTSGPTKERDGTWKIKTIYKLDKLMTLEYNKSYKSTKIKLIWPFTSSAGRENGKKNI
jgi:hypothetical protein